MINDSNDVVEKGKWSVTVETLLYSRQKGYLIKQRIDQGHRVTIGFNGKSKEFNSVRNVTVGKFIDEGVWRNATIHTITVHTYFKGGCQ